MKMETVYLILKTDGRSFEVKDQAIEPASLASFLAGGWRPVRETAFPEGGSILILLEREVEGSFGFGFQPG